MTKILIVEDELFVRENIVDLLEAEDFEVFSTENGILGILWAQENLPDLIICDVMMPEINGHEVIEEIRKLPETALTPFIFLTAMSDKDDIRQGMELGADDYLTKPFTRNELLSAISSRLLKHAKVMEQYNEEHQKVEILERQLQEIKELQIKQEINKEYRQALSKINTAIKLINKIQPGQKRDRTITLVKQTCSTDIATLKKHPDLEAKICSQSQTLATIFQD